MHQHRRASTRWYGDSAVFQQMDSFYNKDVVILDMTQNIIWNERDVKDVIYVNREQPSLNKGGRFVSQLGEGDHQDSVITKILKKF